MPAYRGAVLAPWPNRLANGAYEFDGIAYAVPTNEAIRRTALHGLVAFAPFTMVHHDGRSVTLACVIDASDAFPTEVTLTVTYSINTGGLTVIFRAHNSGGASAPYGCSIHPYLVAGSDSMDDWTLVLDANEVMLVDDERLLPLSVETVDGTTFDFRLPRKIGRTAIDNAYRGVDPERRELTLLSSLGGGVKMSWGPECPWVQLHTADRLGPIPGQPPLDGHRAGLAVEPMTCPPDAFNSGIDVVHLAPGETHEARWLISAI